MPKRITGRYERTSVGGEEVAAFIPYPLPPAEPPIEGTQATLVDLLAFEAEREEQDSRPNADVEEVCNYLDALTFTRAELANPTGLPLSMRLLNETHRRLMRGVRGAERLPGEIRRSQNWIGAAAVTTGLIGDHFHQDHRYPGPTC